MRARNANSVIINVSHGKRGARLRVPANRPLTDLMPDVAKKLGVLDPTLVYAGYHLVRADSTELLDSTSLRDQQVRDGERLTLVVNALDDRDMVYDDVVEAVGQAVERAHRPWTRKDTTLTALVISCGVLAVSAVSLAVVPASALAAAACAVTAAALLGIALVLNGRNLDDQALALAMTACLFGAVCGWKAADLLPTAQASPGPGLPTLAAGCGCLLTGLVAMGVVSHRRLHTSAPLIVGAALAVVGLLCLAMPQWSSRVWTLALAVVGLAATALPWLSLSFSRLSVDSPMSEAEIFALPKPIDIAQVRDRYRRGSTLLSALRAAAGVTVVIGVPTVVGGPSPAGTLMVLAILTGMLLDSRRVYARSQMLVTLVTAGIGLCVAAAACARLHPQWTPFLAVAFALGALACTLTTQVTRRDSIMRTRAADTADVICTVAVPPLAYLALGL